MTNGISPDAGSPGALVLIGADGFIGNSVHQSLVQNGWTVHATVFQRPPATGEIRLDVTRPDDFNALPAGIPVINAAGLPDQSASNSLMRKVHVGGMKNLLHWGASCECPHLIQLSSVSVYGNATVGIGRSEAATRRRTWNPITASLPYGRTKARAEALLESSGLPWTALRLPAVYGPGDSFFTQELYTLLTGESGTLPPGGDKLVSLMPVDRMGPLLGTVLNHGPLNAARNAAGAHVPWSEILKTYAEAWDVALNFTSRRRPGSYLNFADPGMQMAACYGTFGAGFPDDILRAELNWTPGGDWRATAAEAARKLKYELERESA